MLPDPHQSKIKDFCQLIHYGMTATGSHIGCESLRTHRPRGSFLRVPTKMHLYLCHHITIPHEKQAAPAGAACILRKSEESYFALVRISSRHFARKASIVIAPRSSPVRVRTETVPFSISRSPTTSI